ncbi:MAG: alpha/beta hydrolase [Propionibacteriales bacterium]|nr:alpha/beta hydrolase [Propionibacteriales bacterium]
MKASLLAAAVLLAGCGSSSADDAAPASATEATPSPGIARSFNANGHELFLECVGDGSPTMVLDVGEGRLRGDLAKIQEAYQARLRVCTYDRANKGDSGAAATPRKGADLVADLHELLRAAEVPGPYLLVGHSAGGLIAQAYAATYPAEVAGLVAINPVAPWKPWQPVIARMTPSERRDEIAFLSGTNGESLDYRDLSRAVEGLLPSSIPVSLLASSEAECPPGDAACRRLVAQYDAVMHEVARQWGNAPLTIVDASHDIQFDDLPAVTAAIDDVLARATRARVLTPGPPDGETLPE